MFKNITTVMLIAMPLLAINAQVGIGTQNPDPSSELHIESNDSGLLIPRLTSAERDAITSPAIGLMIYNLDTDEFQYNSGTVISPTWATVNNKPSVSTDAGNELDTGSDGGALMSRRVHMGKFIINGTGNISITTIPFEPSQIKFTAYANIENYNIDADNQVGNNNNTIQNTFGSMCGFATNYGGTLEQQVIFNGGSGNSINDISRYASNSHAVAIRYTNQNGNSLGLTSAQVTTFNPDGFIIDVDSHVDDLVIIYEAYR